MDSLTEAVCRSAIAFVIVWRSVFQNTSSTGWPNFRVRMRGGLRGREVEGIEIKHIVIEKGVL